MIRKVELADATDIAGIYNDYVENTTISFEIELISVEDMCKRITEISSHYPYFVFESGGKVVGYCYVHAWKERMAYCKTVETTIYIAPGSKGLGIGERLMRRLIEECGRRGYHALVACITGGNVASMRLHEKLGFKQVSLFREVGWKFGELLDVVDYELIL